MLDERLRFWASGRKLELSWQGNTAGATSVCVLVETIGAWVLTASGTIGEEKRLVLDVPQLVALIRLVEGATKDRMTDVDDVAPPIDNYTTRLSAPERYLTFIEDKTRH